MDTRDVGLSPDAMRSPRITAQEFAQRYAERSGMTLLSFAAWARRRRAVFPCDCDQDGCEGWKMASPEFREPWEEEGIPLIDLVV